MPDARTYRRVPKDLKEVDYIVALIDSDVKARAGDLATTDTDALRDLLNTQKRWREMRADLHAWQPTAPQATPPTAQTPGSPVPEPPPEEVKPEPRTSARTKSTPPANA